VLVFQSLDAVSQVGKLRLHRPLQGRRRVGTGVGSCGESHRNGHVVLEILNVVSTCSIWPKIRAQPRLLPFDAVQPLVDLLEAPIDLPKTLIDLLEALRLPVLDPVEALQNQVQRSFAHCGILVPWVLNPLPFAAAGDNVSECDRMPERRYSRPRTPSHHGQTPAIRW
jgi:hypothetical protein